MTSWQPATPQAPAVTVPTTADQPQALKIGPDYVATSGTDGMRAYPVGPNSVIEFPAAPTAHVLVKDAENRPIDFDRIGRYYRLHGNFDSFTVFIKARGVTFLRYRQLRIVDASSPVDSLSDAFTVLDTDKTMRDLVTRWARQAGYTKENCTIHQPCFEWATDLDYLVTPGLRGMLVRGTLADALKKVGAAYQSMTTSILIDIDPKKLRITAQAPLTQLSAPMVPTSIAAALPEPGALPSHITANSREWNFAEGDNVRDVLSYVLGTLGYTLDWQIPQGQRWLIRDSESFSGTALDALRELRGVLNSYARVDVLVPKTGHTVTVTVIDAPKPLQQQ